MGKKRWGIVVVVASVLAGTAWAADNVADENHWNTKDPSPAPQNVIENSVMLSDVRIDTGLNIRVGYPDADVTVTGSAGSNLTITHEAAALNIISGDHAAEVELNTTPDGEGGNLTLNKGLLYVTANVGRDATKNATMTVGGDFCQKSGGVTISASEDGNAALKVAGKSVLTGGMVDLTQGAGKAGTASFTALAHDIANGAQISLTNETELIATGTGATTVSIHDGGSVSSTLSSATPTGGKIVGTTGASFELVRNGMLDLSGSDILVQGFTGTVKLDGILNYNVNSSFTLGDPDTFGEVAVEDAGNTILGAKTKVIVSGTLAQKLAENAAAITDSTDKAVRLIKGVDGKTNFDAFIGSTGTKSLQHALGKYTLTVGDRFTTSDPAKKGTNGELYITKAENVVDFVKGANAREDADRYASNQKNFASNMSALYGSPILSSGLMDQVLGVAIRNNLLAPDQINTKYDTVERKPDGSRIGFFNRAVLHAMATGYGTSVGNSSDSILAAGTVEMYEGGISGKINEVSQGAVRQTLTGVGDRLASLRHGMAALGLDSGDALASAMLNADIANRVWAGGLGMWEDADRRDGFDGYKYNSYGVQVGYDHLFGPVTAGGAFGYQTGDYKDKAMDSNDSTIDNYSFNLYATYTHESGFFATLMGGYAMSDNNIKFGSGGISYEQNYHADSWYVEGKAGYDIRANGFTLTPAVGVGYMRTDSKGHDAEAVGYGNPLSFSKVKSDSGYVPVSLDARYDFRIGCGRVFTVSANGGYTYSFKDDPARGTMVLNGMALADGTPVAEGYSIIGRSRGHGMWNAGVGMKYGSERWEVGAKYDYYGKADADAHRVFGYAGVKF